MADWVVRLVEAREVDEHRDRSLPDDRTALLLDPPARQPTRHREDATHPGTGELARRRLRVPEEVRPHELQHDSFDRRLVSPAGACFWPARLL